MLIDEGWLARTVGAVVGAAAAADVVAGADAFVGAAAAGAEVTAGGAAGAELPEGLLEQAARSGTPAARAAAPRACFKKSRRDRSNGCMAPSIVGGLHKGVKERLGLHKGANCPYIHKELE